MCGLIKGEFYWGLVVGAIAGGLTGLLLAPTSGGESRAWLGEQTRGAGEKVRLGSEQVAGRARELVGRGRQLVTQLRDSDAEPQQEAG